MELRVARARRGDSGGEVATPCGEVMVEVVVAVVVVVR